MNSVTPFGPQGLNMVPKHNHFGHGDLRSRLRGQLGAILDQHLKCQMVIIVEVFEVQTMLPDIAIFAWRPPVQALSSWWSMT